MAIQTKRVYKVFLSTLPTVVSQKSHKAYANALAHHGHPGEAAEIEPQQLLSPRNLHRRRHGVAQVSPRRLQPAVAILERE